MGLVGGPAPAATPPADCMPASSSSCSANARRDRPRRKPARPIVANTTTGTEEHEQHRTRPGNLPQPHPGERSRNGVRPITRPTPPHVAARFGLPRKPAARVQSPPRRHADAGDRHHARAPAPRMAAQSVALRLHSPWIL